MQFSSLTNDNFYHWEKKKKLYFSIYKIIRFSSSCDTCNRVMMTDNFIFSVLGLSFYLFMLRKGSNDNMKAQILFAVTLV